MSSNNKYWIVFNKDRNIETQHIESDCHLVFCQTKEQAIRIVTDEYYSDMGENLDAVTLKLHTSKRTISDHLTNNLLDNISKSYNDLCKRIFTPPQIKNNQNLILQPSIKDPDEQYLSIIKEFATKHSDGTMDNLRRKK
jgi:uncharacterized membrane-anchored protein YhcB (DUF1043 family)